MSVSQSLAASSCVRWVVGAGKRSSFHWTFELIRNKAEERPWWLLKTFNLVSIVQIVKSGVPKLRIDYRFWPVFLVISGHFGLAYAFHTQYTFFFFHSQASKESPCRLMHKSSYAAPIKYKRPKVTCPESWEAMLLPVWSGHKAHTIYAYKHKIDRTNK